MKLCQNIFNYIVVTFVFCMISACAATGVAPEVPKTEPSTSYLRSLHPQVVLVLGSGSARGFAHAGVIKVLEENHVPIDMIIGTSAGSIVGALYADHPDASRLEKLLLNTPKDQVIAPDYTHFYAGLFNGLSLQHFLKSQMRAVDFKQLKIPFVAVATDLETNKTHLFASGPIAPAVNASSAVTPFFSPVKLYGKTYVDGGYIDPVAVDVAKIFHPKLIIAVSLDYPLEPTLPTVSVSLLLRTYNMMQRQLIKLSAQDADVIISPVVKNIDMFDGSQRQVIIQAGETATKNRLPMIRKLLCQKEIKTR